jgi:hypothetical protein
MKANDYPHSVPVVHHRASDPCPAGHGSLASYLDFAKDGRTCVDARDLGRSGFCRVRGGIGWGPEDNYRMRIDRIVFVASDWFLLRPDQGG